MQNTPGIFVRILVPFVIGIWISHEINFAKLNLLIYLTVFLLFILLLIFNILYILLKVYNYKLSNALLPYIFFFFLGCLSEINAYEFSKPDHFSSQYSEFLKIYIDEEPRISGKSIRFQARIIRSYTAGKMTNKMGGLLVNVLLKKGSLHQFDYGKVYLIPARFSPVPPPLNPAEFDNKSWLANQNIYQQTHLSEDELIPIREVAGSALIRFALSLRKTQVLLYRKLLKDDNAFAVASTLILGYRADLGAAILSAYTTTGTIHALSVSGMHVGIIYVILEWGFRPMNRNYVLKWLKVLLMLGLIWFYTLICGYSSSVLRSAIMLSMFILAKSLHKDTGSFHILALSAFCLLFYKPFLLWDVGFQLSYMAVSGLVYLQPKIYQLFFFNWTGFQKVWGALSLSIAAQVFTFPFSIYYFHQFPLYFLLSNLFITLPVIVLMYLGLTILLLDLHCLALPFEWLLNFMNRGLEKIASLPYATLNQIWLSKLGLCLLCFCTLFLIRGIFDKKKSNVFIALILLILLEGMLARDKINAKEQEQIIVFSLYKDYAVAFIHGEKAILITNLLQKDRAFKFHIQPALDQRRISRVVCVPWKKEMDSKQLNLKNHVLQFQQFRVLMLDSFFNRLQILERPFFDAVWIHGNPDITLEEARKRLRFKHVWVDATNFKSKTMNLQNLRHL